MSADGDREIVLVSDLLYRLTYEFDLKSQAPNGIYCDINGFAVPPSQSICIFKDDECVNIK